MKDSENKIRAPSDMIDILELNLGDKYHCQLI